MIHIPHRKLESGGRKSIWNTVINPCLCMYCIIQQLHIIVKLENVLQCHSVDVYAFATLTACCVLDL